jgi:two-component system, chemotaxis family, CheB/CheR fusion protein
MTNSKSSKSYAEKTSSNGDGKKDFIVVGIGASAGGVKALQDFFERLPADSGMAFVIILHLSPTHESNLATIIQAKTEMPVTAVTETVRIEPNHVYVITPQQQLAMVDGTIQTARFENKNGKRAAIDTFFRTLAEAFNKKAVGVVLSGTGADGTIGIKHIKEKEGFAIVQKPEDAEYDEMPRSAVKTGLIDWILPVAEIPEKLITFRESSDRLNLTADNDAKIAKEIKGIEGLQEIIKILRSTTGLDFSNYKQGTLVRRIARHLQIHNLEDIPSYVNLLRENSQEVHSLLKNLLINVTNFFRDQKAFKALEKDVVPKIFEGKGPNDSLRVWVAGCASGEEAYSIAILLSEYASQLSEPPKLQIFATDVDEEAINEARENTYPETIEADVSPERLRRFFYKEGKTYRVRKELREMILFAPHNVLHDPPFSRLDLVTCRNLLIYLNRTAQEKILGTFHFALLPHGFLFLGNSETVESITKLFKPVDKKQRIYLRADSSVPKIKTPLKTTPVENFQIKSGETRLPRSGNQPSASISDLHFRLVEQYAPPSVLINDQYEIVHLSESAGKYFKFSGGEPTTNIFKVVHPDLQTDLRTALFASLRENRSTEFHDIRVNLDGEEVFINLIVRQTGIAETGQDYFLVIFDESIITDQHQTVKISSGELSGETVVEAVVRGLEDDLRRTKERLRATIEQHETSIEELKASNEELQAMNEELRSATEELETSKEEQQSVNEELTAVNQELKETIDDLSRANSDMQNLLSSSSIATIFLDRSLSIKRYTTPVEELFNIVPTDINRPLEHFTHRLNYPNLVHDAEEVLRTLQPSDHEISSRDGRFYIARFSPYRTMDDHIDGVILNFIEITARKRTEEALRDSEERFRLMVDSVPESIWITDAEGRVEFLNKHWYDYCGVTEGQATAAEIAAEFLHPDDAPRVLQAFAEALRAGSSFEVEQRNRSATGEYRWFLNRAQPYRDSKTGEITKWVGVGIDIHDRKLAEQVLRFQGHLLDTVEQSVIATDLEGKITYWNQFAEKLYGWTAEEAVGRSIMDLTPLTTDLEQAEEIMSLLRQGKTWAGEFKVRRRDDSTFLAEVFNTPITDDKGSLIGMVGVSTNVTRRKKMEDALRESEERLRLLVESIDDYAILTLTPDGRIDSWNPGAEQIFGYSEEEILGQSCEILFTPEDRELKEPEKEIKTAIETGRAADERWHLRKDKSRFYASGVLNVLGDNPENGFVKILRDLTERKQFEETLRVADRRKDEFLATLAHELRNPLAPIKSGLEVIRRAGCEEATMQNTLGIIERQTDQIIHLVDDLLEISRITQGKIKLRKRRIELKDAVEMAMESVQGMLGTDGHQISVDLPDESVYVNADLMRITQVLLNLLNNSVKYTQPGGKIRLTAEKDEKEAVISVKDTGIGIPPEMLSKVFDMFAQVKNTSEQARSGLGIGLSVVKKLIEMHGGTVQAFSEGEGEGSEFVVRLPLAEEQAAGRKTKQLSEKETAQSAILKTAKANEKSFSKTHKILVIDDNADAANMLEILLSMEGHEVRAAFDAESGIEVAKEFKPGVCLLDIGLPEMNGYEAAIILRRFLPDALLISISGWGQEEDRQHSREAGFDYHLVKPVEIEDIKKLLDENA